ncbi:MAG TPA: NfeD family protein [Kiritimatiellia bacterium]|nr:NfeD family protein [Kiritimatiellia bacterium]HMP34965.1 NfeD family protein [Kiritimatiellia bacterium]
MSPDLTTYIALVGGGFVLIAAEIFIPGGILGVVGVIALLSAGVLGFSVFGLSGGLISAIGLLIGGTVFLGLWVKYCPTSFFGRWFTLKEDGREFKSYDNHLDALLDLTGTAHTDLRPSGIAMIGQQKIDVLSEAGFVTKGTPVKVIQVAGNRVVVRALEPTANTVTP